MGWRASLSRLTPPLSAATKIPGPAMFPGKVSGIAESDRLPCGSFLYFLKAKGPVRVTEYIIIGVFALVGLLFAGAAMVFSRIVAPRFPDTGKKLDAYESGEDAIGSARIQFRIGYYLFALVFLVFDVEAIFLFPVLGVLRSAGEGALPVSALFVWCELMVFLAILGFALFYAWRKKALQWE